MRATLTGLVFLAALAAISIWWLYSITRERPPVSVERGPDWYFDDAWMTATGSDGDLQYRLHARRVEHDPADGSARVSTVHMEWLQDGTPPLMIDSARAVVSADGTSVLLGGGVRITDDTPAGPMELVTESLHVDAGAHEAYTADPVSITVPNGTLTAVGLNADSRTGIIRLEQQVRGRYAN